MHTYRAELLPTARTLEEARPLAPGLILIAESTPRADYVYYGTARDGSKRFRKLQERPVNDGDGAADRGLTGILHELDMSVEV